MNTNLSFQKPEIFIATFYSHFGAIRFKKGCDKINVEAKLMPVPRNLSSSCGTCVRFEALNACPLSEWPTEAEQVVRIADGGNSYEEMYRAEGS